MLPGLESCHAEPGAPCPGPPPQQAPPQPRSCSLLHVPALLRAVGLSKTPSGFAFPQVRSEPNHRREGFVGPGRNARTLPLEGGGAPPRGLGWGAKQGLCKAHRAPGAAPPPPGLHRAPPSPPHKGKTPKAQRGPPRRASPERDAARGNLNPAWETQAGGRWQRGRGVRAQLGAGGFVPTPPKTVVPNQGLRPDPSADLPGVPAAFFLGISTLPPALRIPKSPGDGVGGRPSSKGSCKAPPGTPPFRAGAAPPHPGLPRPLPATGAQPRGPRPDGGSAVPALFLGIFC